MEKERVKTADGLTLVRRVWKKENPLGHMLIVHGIAEYGGRYEHVGNYFNEHGLQVTAPDMRGCGESEGSIAYVNKFDDFFDDIDANFPKNGPKILFGHSLGGLKCLAYTLSNRKKPDLLILSAPAIDSATPKWMIYAASILAHLIPKFRIGNVITGEQLSRDPEVGKRYFSDPLVHPKTTTRLGNEIFKTMKWTSQRLYELDIPTLVLHGGNDTIVPEAVSQPFADLPNVERVVFEDFHHEIFNEIGQEDVMKRVWDWLKPRI